jgi:hypothetical protein
LTDIVGKRSNLDHDFIARLQMKLFGLFREL